MASAMAPHVLHRSCRHFTCCTLCARSFSSEYLEDEKLWITHPYFRVSKQLSHLQEGTHHLCVKRNCKKSTNTDRRPPPRGQAQTNTILTPTRLSCSTFRLIPRVTLFRAEEAEPTSNQAELLKSKTELSRQTEQGKPRHSPWNISKLQNRTTTTNITSDVALSTSKNFCVLKQMHHTETESDARRATTPLPLEACALRFCQYFHSATLTFQLSLFHSTTVN